jgi:hypothetical protein
MVAIATHYLLDIEIHIWIQQREKKFNLLVVLVYGMLSVAGASR